MNRVAIVTGASRGIGRATAIRLACDFSTVALVARTQKHWPRQLMRSGQRERNRSSSPATWLLTRDPQAALEQAKRAAVDCAGARMRLTLSEGAKQ